MHTRWSDGKAQPLHCRLEAKRDNYQSYNFRFSSSYMPISGAIHGETKFQQLRLRAQGQGQDFQ